MARPADWIGLTVVLGTDMHGDDTVGTLEEVNDRGVVVRHGIVEVESEVVEFEADPEGDVVEIGPRSRASPSGSRSSTPGPRSIGCTTRKRRPRCGGFSCARIGW
jgi:hypothetical protein